MQKKLIALAIAGLSSAAFAQSNVTIYGVMDATYDNVKAGGSAAGTAGTSYASRGRTTMNSSYFGLKGTEALGNGMSVAWQIENGVGENGGATSTVGATAYSMASRDTFLALAGGFGTIAAGTLTGPTRAMGAAMDVNAGATGIGANAALIGKLGGGSGAGYFDQRFANAIAYISPNMGGFTGVAAYVPNENRSRDNNTPANGIANTSAWNLGLTYNNGPIYAGLAHAKIKDKAAGQDAGVTLTTSGFGPANTGLGAVYVKTFQNNRAAAKYTFGQGTIGLMWDQTKAEVTSAGGAATNMLTAKQSVYYIPFTYTIGSGKVIAQYGKARNATGSAVAANTDYKATHVVLGYEHNLSKRTVVKALYSAITNKNNAGYDFLYGVSAPNTTASGAAINAGTDPKGFSVGMRHSF